MRTDDATLIHRYQLGDRTALDALISRHHARAFDHAFHLTHDREQAGDVVADAFLRVCRSLVNFRGQSSFSTWLYRIIVNSYLDGRKRSLSRPAMSLDAWLVTDTGELQLDSRDPGPSAQFEVERQVEAACLRRAIKRLPPDQQSILVLFHIYSMSYEEITSASKLPLGTVKSRLNRARVAMRQLLAADREMLMAA
jgi:RNA polymerase sigma-70 factor (ECF subfamily)